MIIDVDKKPKAKFVVLKPQINDLEIQEIVNKKKTKFFRHMLKTPKPSEVHVHSVILVYEPLMILSGRYKADFLRKAIHEIKIERNVKEIILGDGVFPASNFVTGNGIGSKLRKNTVSLNVEEHVYVEEEKEITVDHHGEPRNFTYKVDTKDVENYPKRTLKKNTVKEFEITEDEAVKILAKSLQERESFEDVRDLNESLTVDEIVTIYVPIYEARLVGPKKKVEILRFDTIRKKML